MLCLCVTPLRHVFMFRVFGAASRFLAGCATVRQLTVAATAAATGVTGGRGLCDGGSLLQSFVIRLLLD